MITLKVISPERELLSAEVDLVELPGTLGRFEVLKDHGALLSSLVKGSIRWQNADGESSLEIKEGFVEVRNNEIHACVEV